MEMDMSMDITEETKKRSRGGTYISCMQSGGGEDSYANISLPQNFIFRVYTRSHLSEALDYLCTSPHILGLFQRVDKTRFLKGCSSIASQTREDATVLEIEYLFSDLPENDFNSLFRSLPSFLQGIADQAHPACKIFTGGVPGSFHGPLFPTSSLHFATSAYSLQWLSQAFASQYRKDMRCFFQQRARELVKGGVLFLLLPCRAELHPSGALYDPRLDLWSGFFESTWSDI
ncbi:hypothetical protein KP509_06G004600 [Ceratopteris richardii]|uniref:Uncharacterized protein n=1 Tax=Ceratopteris richardii TaxID=49495 RepID=A0A8T2UJZ0_CERRI|nr:hypothetical protein KP509_06G004600 [Ceratopteris richardii]